MSTVNDMGDPVITAKPREVLLVLSTIEVGKGEVFFPLLSIVAKEDGKLYCVQYKKFGLPSPNQLQGDDCRGQYSKFSYIKLGHKDSLMMIDVIACWTKCTNKDYLNPFTFMYATMLARYHVDLFEIGVFEV
jgi:hypothetical protein